ncbi:hypothetical protein FNJ84_17690 [Paracoccus sp. M683]|uniref:phage tail tip fiber protein n=1 Tax=Paracoccus sp. M683 TaxID=2594268 RepID=UPI00117ED88B|nr:hypothetical protein [Paracoccus sp. M683]TRW94925.1 hypothetical protein FNJ84_17690 [Paracoccus sp. M683]
MNNPTLDRALRAKIEEILGERGTKPNQAVRFRDIEGLAFGAGLAKQVKDIAEKVARDIAESYDGADTDLAELQAEVADLRHRADAAATAAANAEAAAANATAYTDAEVQSARDDLAVDYQTAVAAAQDALAHADEAEQWSISSEANVTRLFPEDFRDDGAFWTENLGLPPTAASVLPPFSQIMSEALVGDFIRLEAVASRDQRVVSRGVIRFSEGRTIRVTAKVRTIGGTSGKLRLLFAVKRADYTNARNLFWSNALTTSTADTWQTFTFDQLLPAPQANEVWLQIGLYANSNATPDVDCDIAFIRIEDVTSLVAGEQAAAAAEIARTDAIAAKGDAESASAAAQSSATLAASSEAAAASQADAAGNSADAAGNSADAAASSATLAGTEADAAGSSAVAANTARLAAETARTGSQSAQAGSQLARDEAVTARQNAETAAASAQTTLTLNSKVSSRGVGVLEDQFLQASEWSEIKPAGNTITKTANALYPIGQTWEFQTAGTNDVGIRILDSPSSIWSGTKNAKAYVAEVEFTPVSGLLTGAAVRLFWKNTVGTGFATTALFSNDALAAPSDNGRTNTFRALLKRPAGFSGTFYSHTLIVYADVGPNRYAKTIRFHRVNLRPATEEELGLGEVSAAVQATLAENYFTRAETNIAIANADLTLNASLGETFSSVESSKTAIASLNGSVARFRNVVTVNGEQRAGIEVVAFDGAGSGTGSVMKLIGDNVIAEGTLSGREVVVHDGSANMFPDPAFLLKSFSGWTLNSVAASNFSLIATSAIPGAISVNNAKSEACLYITSHPGQGDAIMSSPKFSVAPGEQFELGYDLAVQLGQYHMFSLRLRVHDKDGALLATLGVQTDTATAAWRTFSGTVTIPANATHADIQVVSRDVTGMQTGYAAASNFTVIRKRTGRTLITPNSLTTDLVDTNDFNASGLAVFGGTLQSDNFNQANGTGWRITKAGQLIVPSASITTANLEDASITSAKIGNTIQSDNFNQANGTGWRLSKNGGLIVPHASIGTLDLDGRAVTVQHRKVVSGNSFSASSSLVISSTPASDLIVGYTINLGYYAGPGSDGAASTSISMSLNGTQLIYGLLPGAYGVMSLLAGGPARAGNNNFTVTYETNVHVGNAPTFEIHQIILEAKR